MCGTMSNNHENNEQAENSFEEFRNAVRELEMRRDSQPHPSVSARVQREFRSAVVAVATKWENEGFVSEEELAEIRAEKNAAEESFDTSDRVDEVFCVPPGLDFDGNMEKIRDESGVLDGLRERCTEVFGNNFAAIDNPLLEELCAEEENFCIRAYEVYGDCGPAFRFSVSIYDEIDTRMVALFNEADRKQKYSRARMMDAKLGKSRALWAAVWDMWYDAAESWWHRTQYYGDFGWRDYFCENLGADYYGAESAWLKAAITATGKILKEARERRGRPPVE